MADCLLLYGPDKRPQLRLWLLGSASGCGDQLVSTADAAGTRPAADTSAGSRTALQPASHSDVHDLPLPQQGLVIIVDCKGWGENAGSSCGGQHAGLIVIKVARTARTFQRQNVASNEASKD